jgi:hypothetical protein
MAGGWLNFMVRKIYKNRGGTFLLNCFDVEGEKYPFEMVEQLANKERISFRTGCFCNPGIDELNNCISAEQLRTYFVSREHGDYYDFINFTKKMRGAVRISIGLATTASDIRKLISFLAKFQDKVVPLHHHALLAIPATNGPNYQLAENRIAMMTFEFTHRFKKDG